MIYDIEQLGSQRIDPQQVTRPERRRMMREVIKHLSVPGHEDWNALSPAASTPEDARRLWAQIQAGEHPLTSEGIVGHPATGRPWKSKLLEESDVHVTGVFPGEGRLAGTGAGGFEYGLEPGGPTVGRVGTGLSDETRQELLADPEAYIGRVAKIRSQGQFPDSGAHRAPSLLAFHEDYPLLTKEGDVLQGPQCPYGNDLFGPEAGVSLVRGFEKDADEEERPPIVAVDLDGTILEYDGWKGEDHFGKPRVGARKGLRELQRTGNLVVIHTCRGNTQAVKDVLHEHDLPYDYVNENPHQPPGTSDKIQAEVYIDDRAVQARQPWSQITKETKRRLKAAQAGPHGSFYLAAVPGTPSTFDPNQSAVQNLIRQLGAVRQRGDQAIREAYTRNSLANAADPSRSTRQFSAYLAGRRKPIVHHWFDRIIRGEYNL
jgi:arginine repressor